MVSLLNANTLPERHLLLTVRVFIYCACLRGVLLLIAPALVIAYALMHPPREYLL